MVKFQIPQSCPEFKLQFWNPGQNSRSPAAESANFECNRLHSNSRILARILAPIPKSWLEFPNSIALAAQSANFESNRLHSNSRILVGIQASIPESRLEFWNSASPAAPGANFECNWLRSTSGILAGSPAPIPESQLVFPPAQAALKAQILNVIGYSQILEFRPSLVGGVSRMSRPRFWNAVPFFLVRRFYFRLL